jgi:hypothetical protein
MRSPYNPTAEDLRSWAYDGQEEAPAQDWDLILSTISYEDLFIELASDIDCPKSVFFLSLLYLIVGDAVRSEFRTKKKEEIETLLDKAQQAAPKHWIYLWIQRSRELLIHPEKFNYDDWCGGVLARADEA